MREITIGFQLGEDYLEMNKKTCYCYHKYSTFRVFNEFLYDNKDILEEDETSECSLSREIKWETKEMKNIF